MTHHDECADCPCACEMNKGSAKLSCACGACPECGHNLRLKKKVKR